MEIVNDYDNDINDNGSNSDKREYIIYAYVQYININYDYEH